MSVPVAGMWRSARLVTGEVLAPPGGLYATVTADGLLAAVAYCENYPAPGPELRGRVVPAHAVAELAGWLGNPGAIDWPLNITWRA